MSETAPIHSSWPEALREEMLPLAEAMRDRVVALLRDGRLPEFCRSDLDRLDTGSTDLLGAVHGLPETGRKPGDPAETARHTRHSLLNNLNRLLGYGQLLLEEGEDLEVPVRIDLQGLVELSRECERIVLRHLSRDAAPRDAPTGTATGPGEGRILDVAPGRILVVEDDPGNRESLVRSLRVLGHTLSEADDGLVAVEMIRQQAFDLILLDIHLPGADGYEVLRQIRADPRRQSVPVLVISGLDERANTIRCLERGAEDFLAKPIDHVFLRARVNSLLLRRQLRVRELEQFFPPEVARQLLDQPDVLEEGTETEITVMFCDIRGYSRISRRLGPANTIEWVSAVMEELSDCLLRNGGVLIDFIGDELLAMWGAPTAQPDHARRACKTALEMFACLPGLNERWEQKVGEPVALSIGINSGPAWVGNTGTRRKFKYGAMGNTVNLGSRVQGATKYVGASLVVTRATHDQLDAAFLSRRLMQVRVVNISDPVELYQVVPSETTEWDELRASYEQALKLYETRQLDQAARLLGQLIATQGAAGPPLALMARTIEALRQPDSWDPVFELPGK